LRWTDTTRFTPPALTGSRSGSLGGACWTPRSCGWRKLCSCWSDRLPSTASASPPWPATTASAAASRWAASLNQFQISKAHAFMCHTSDTIENHLLHIGPHAFTCHTSETIENHLLHISLACTTPGLGPLKSKGASKVDQGRWMHTDIVSLGHERV